MSGSLTLSDISCKSETESKGDRKVTRKKRIFLIIGVLAFMVVAGVILGVVTAGNHNADSRNSSATPGEAQADTEGKEESDVLPAVPIQAENAGATEAVAEQSGEDVSVTGNGGTPGVSGQDSQTKPAGSSGTQGGQTKPADSSGTQDGQNEQANPGTNGKKTDKPTTEKMTTESTTTTEQKTTEQTTETPDDSGVVELPFVPAD